MSRYPAHTREALVGKVYGARVVSDVITVTDTAGVKRRRAVLTCPCGRVSQIDASRINARVTKCICENRVNGATRHRDYSADVGQIFGGFFVVAFESAARPTFTLRCLDGHTFRRYAWDTVKGDVKTCPTCTAATRGLGPDTRRRDYRKPAPMRGPDSVCDCTWRDGRQVRVCAQHRKAS